MRLRTEKKKREKRKKTAAATIRTICFVVVFSKNLSPNRKKTRSVHSLFLFLPTHQLLRIGARPDPTRLDDGHGDREKQRHDGGVARRIDGAGDAGDGRVVAPQDHVRRRDGAPQRRHELLDAVSLAGPESRDDDGLAGERERRGGGHFALLFFCD